MNDPDPRIHDAFEALVPPTNGHGDWERVHAEARRPSRRRWIGRAAAVVLAAAVAAVAALAWPFDAEPPTALERALAATGEGPVLHLVLRGDWGPTLVDLQSGERTPIHGETEVWFDEQRGLHEITLLGGKPQGAVFYGRDEIPAAAREQYAGLATRYREALQSGSARIVGEGTAAGRPVYWIEVYAEWLPDSSDGRDHLFAHEVGVDRQTYEAVYFRTTRDREPPPGRGAGTTIETLEWLPAGEGNFRPARERNVPSAPLAPRVGLAFGFGWDEEIDLQEADDELKGGLLWLGRSYDAKPLATVRKLMLGRRHPQETGWNRTPGVVLFYGELHPNGQPDHRKPRVVIEQARSISPAWRGIPGQAPAEIPRGSVVALATGEGFMQIDGVYVSIYAGNEQDMLAVARALRPFD